MTVLSADSSMAQNLFSEEKAYRFKNNLGFRAFREAIVARIPRVAFPTQGERWSGKVYKLESNRFRIKTLSFDFRGREEAIIKMNGPYGYVRIPIRTDSVYRFLHLRGIDGRAIRQVGIRGRWIGKSAFRLEWLVVGEPNRYVINLFFFGESIVASIRKAQDRWGHFWVQGNIAN